MLNKTKIINDLIYKCIFDLYKSAKKRENLINSENLAKAFYCGEAFAYKSVLTLLMEVSNHEI